MSKHIFGVTDPSDDALRALAFMLRGPEKHVRSHKDLSRWTRSRAYHDVVAYVNNTSMAIQGHRLSGKYPVTLQLQKLCLIFISLERLMQRHPPMRGDQASATSEKSGGPGPMPMPATAHVPHSRGCAPIGADRKHMRSTESLGQQSGNRAYRSWARQMHQHVFILLDKAVRPKCKHVNELGHYLSLAFGSSARIDYGPGNELMFIFFLCGLFKAEILLPDDTVAAALLLFDRYIRLVRCLIQTYSMAPTYNRGQWAVDDYYVLPYLWGCAQLAQEEPFSPKECEQEAIVKYYRTDFMLLDSIDHLNMLRSGRLGEHSYQLWCILSLPEWTDAYSGLIRTYLKDVLGEFQTVQHAIFGELMSYDLAPTDALLQRAYLGKLPEIVIAPKRGDEDSEKEESGEEIVLETKEVVIPPPIPSGPPKPPVAKAVKTDKLFLDFNDPKKLSDHTGDANAERLRLARTYHTLVITKTSNVIFPMPQHDSGLPDINEEQCALQFNPAEVEYLVKDNTIQSSFFNM